MTKVLCKLIFALSDMEQPMEMVGEIYRHQLISQECQWLTIETKYLDKGEMNVIQSIVHKSDVLSIYLVSESIRYSVERRTFALNIHMSEFAGVEI